MEFTKYNFGPELMKTNIDLDLCKELLSVGRNEILIHNKIDSITFDTSYKYSFENVSYFKNKISVYIENYIKEIAKIRNLKLFRFGINIEDLWINFQKSRDFNSPHFHAYDISFVIYVDMPDEIKNEKTIKGGFQNGSISFLYGQNVKKFDLNAQQFSNAVNGYMAPITQINHLPITGEMFIFPAYLMHYVNPFFTKDIERISVAGNVSLIDNKKSII